MFLNLNVKKVDLRTFQFGVKSATKDIKAIIICNPVIFNHFSWETLGCSTFFISINVLFDSDYGRQ